jgi:hypothetical protein
VRAVHYSLVALLLLIVAAVLTSCGGGSAATTASSRSPASQRALVKADANCELMLREVKRLAKGVLSSGYKNNLQLTTEGFAMPGMRVVKRMARRQQALAAAIDDPRYDVYAGLFNPIIILAEKRVRAGQDEDLATSINLQERLTTLGIEQQLAANKAGLPACEINFLEAMVKAASA